MQSSIQDPTLELYDIYGLWHVPFWQRSWFIISVVTLASLLIAGIVYFLLKKYRSRKVTVPAWQSALQQLDKIKKSNMLTPEHGQHYYVLLTSLLKSYISSRFAQDVSSLTDAQMCAYIDEHLPYEVHKDNLKQIFSAGQLIKFAHRDVLQVQMLDDWQHAYDFIEGTKDVAK
jgi:LPS O-antigen subunit length determinant protein (WzzB/FepE family)